MKHSRLAFCLAGAAAALAACAPAPPPSEVFLHLSQGGRICIGRPENIEAGKCKMVMNGSAASDGALTANVFILTSMMTMDDVKDYKLAYALPLRSGKDGYCFRGKDWLDSIRLWAPFDPVGRVTDTDVAADEDTRSSMVSSARWSFSLGEKDEQCEIYTPQSTTADGRTILKMTVTRNGDVQENGFEDSAFAVFMPPDGDLTLVHSY
ncbi:MAG TPA: hypothetical protein PLR76_10595 [Hyphomonas sp.]|nr:hypothetical protein [Hyphomonas sp.]HPE48839.1 hypothetical protein [Hyphomonas sp.]